jgi:hypothetical protein
MEKALRQFGDLAASIDMEDGGGGKFGIREINLKRLTILFAVARILP